MIIYENVVIIAVGQNKNTAFPQYNFVQIRFTVVWMSIQNLQLEYSHLMDEVITI